MKHQSLVFVKRLFNRFVTALFLVTMTIGWGSLAHAANLLSNSSFNTVGPLGPSTTITTLVPGGAGFSAAQDWTLFTNTPGTIITRLLPSGLVPGGRMLLVRTNGNHNGLVQVFGPFNTGPKKTVACAWIYVASGEVRVGTGNGGNTGADIVLKKKGSWEYVEIGNGVAPANEFIIYSDSPGGATFYVESARVETSRPRCRCQPQ